MGSIKPYNSVVYTGFYVYTLDKCNTICYNVIMKNLDKENLSAFVITRVKPSVKKLLRDKKISKNLSIQLRHFINKFLGLED